MSMSNSRAISKMRSIWPWGSLSVYGAAPTTEPPFPSASTMSSSVPGLLSSPSCGKMQISTSMAHLYSSTRGSTPSRPRRPMTGSTSSWVRMWVVPFRMHFSSVFFPRS